ncbi:MAG: shikimate kinase [Planctomycetota bacterium]
MSSLREEGNVILIGMPGVGKSTVGVLLAKALSRDFLDTDVLIQSRQARRLQEIIDSDGLAAFCRIEEDCVLSLVVGHYVTATGGSVVYSRRAMEHLRQNGVVVHLYLPLPLLEERLSDLDARGVVMDSSQSLDALFAERDPLCRRWADFVVDCAGLTHEEVVDAIVVILSKE